MTNAFLNAENKISDMFFELNENMLTLKKE
jgi:hypothetical protein